MRRCSWRSST
uniref:Uncharacterized protein n=1 Tax=Arundo donax TaxID=35708 RepID=A0A0A9EK30_ARUDO